MNDLRLVIEVLSPSSARADRFTKRRLYQEAGVPLYWVVDPDERAIEVWTPDARLPAVERERVNHSGKPPSRCGLGIPPAGGFPRRG